jgi:hypothetical protein
MRLCIRESALFLTDLLGTCACVAPGGMEPNRGQDEEWHSTVAPVLWVATISGNALAGDGDGSSAELDEPLGLDSGFMSTAEVGRGVWSVFLEGLYVDYAGSTRDLGGLTTEIGLQAALGALCAARHLGTWSLLDVRARTLTLDGNAGARFAWVDLDIETAGLGGDNAHKDWLDPIVGLRTELAWSEELEASLAGDIGGFGLASDQVWQAAARLIWRPWEGASLFAGYRLLDYDFAEESGVETLRFDVRSAGPFLGLALHL